jgi:hypothetical protein
MSWFARAMAIYHINNDTNFRRPSKIWVRWDREGRGGWLGNRFGLNMARDFPMGFPPTGTPLGHGSRCTGGVVVTWIVASKQFDPPRVQFPASAGFF